jgi:AraC-like DNA-binding protein
MIALPAFMTDLPGKFGKCGMDALSDVLRVARLTGGVFLHADFTAPWCVAGQIMPELCGPAVGPASHIIPYHYVVQGEMDVAVPGSDLEPITIHAGEVVLLPHNDLHLLGSSLDIPPVEAGILIQPSDSGGLFTISHGGGGAPVHIVCGYLGCDYNEGNPVIATLPRLMKLDVDEGSGAEWIRATFQFAAAEVAAGRPGSATVLAKLSELLFVETIRRYLEGLPEDETSWLAGLRDRFVARALSLFHDEVSRPWTIDALSREVGLSRSALADRFVSLIGKAPMQYLAHWRMQVASQELRNTNATLAQIALSVGYDSEAAFSRAFKKAFGAAPASWRRAANFGDATGSSIRTRPKAIERQFNVEA